MNETIDRETLEAYVDGELSPEAMAETAGRLAQDPEALARARTLYQDRALLRATYSEVAEAPVPAALIEAVDRGFARRRQRRSGPAPRYALAAALALAVVGTLAGYLAGEYRLRSELAAQAAQNAEDKKLLAQAVERALEHNTSGTSVAWNNPDSGAHGEVIPVRTYRSKSSHWCREYLASEISAGNEQKTRAIACRDTAGDWVKVEELFYQS